MEKLFLLSDTFKSRQIPHFRRSLYQQIQWDSRLYNAVLGPRGVGKTTLLLQRLNELNLPSNQALFIDLGDIYFTENRLIDTALAFAEQGGKYLFIDEVHRYGFQSWATEIKTIYDALGDRLKLIFTGSSQTQILMRQADLSRRGVFYTMHGFSFREFLQVHLDIVLPTISLDTLTQAHDDYLSDNREEIEKMHHGHFKDYLNFGYYPLYLDDPTAFRVQLNRMVQTVLEMDIPYFLDTPNLKVFQLSKLLQAVATSAPFKPNFSKLSERIGLRRQLVEEYLIALERAKLIHLVPAESKGIASLSKPEKIYLDNPNLIYALSPDTPNLGTVRETFFINQVKPLTERLELVPPHLSIPKKGDFTIEYQERRQVFEVGGPNKESKQIGTKADHFTVVDSLRVAGRQRIPLWMFGLLN
ncbi:MAG: AAA family ATPase [Bacteroidota bacterium]